MTAERYHEQGKKVMLRYFNKEIEMEELNRAFNSIVDDWIEEENGKKRQETSFLKEKEGWGRLK